MCRLVVFPQRIPAEVAVEITPYGADMLDAIFNIVALDQKCGTHLFVIYGE